MVVGVSLVAQVSCDSGVVKAIVIQDGAGIYVEATRAMLMPTTKTSGLFVSLAYNNDKGAKSV